MTVTNRIMDAIPDIAEIFLRRNLTADEGSAVLAVMLGLSIGMKGKSPSSLADLLAAAICVGKEYRSEFEKLERDFHSGKTH